MVPSLRALLLAIVCSMIAPASFGHSVHRYERGLWFDGSGFVARTVWTVDGLFRFTWDGPVDATTDLRGRFVIPPFADAHHHAFGNEHSLAAEVQKFLAEGIFYVKNPNNVRVWTEPVRSKVNRPESVDVAYSNGGFTSTGGHPTQIYAHLAERFGMAPSEMEGEAYFIVDSERDLERVWPRFLATRPDFVKVYLEHSEDHAERAADPAFVGRRGLDPRLIAPIVERARKAGLRVSAHVASAEDFRTAVAAGVDEINHLPLARLTPEDAREAARRRVRIVTTTLSHRPTEGIGDLDALHRHNLTLLRDAGTPLAIGTDDARTAVAEAENVHRLGVFDPAALLSIWTRDTPMAIFPNRKIGRFEEGWEASFLALERNPLEDFSAVREIFLRVKQGRRLEVEPPKVSAIDALAAVFRSKGTEAAIAEFDRMRGGAGAHAVGEAALNALGYLLLRHGKVEDAIAMFRANVERFPRSSNVHDSLGEALMTRGDRAAAIASYEKALELDPKNANAAAMLQKLRAEEPAQRP